MFEIKKVFFNSTVHWPGSGPIDEVTEHQFRDAMWVENMPGFAFEHADATVTWVPASNIRWVQAVIQGANVESVLEDETQPTTPTNIEDAPKRRGRPRKIH